MAQKELDGKVDKGTQHYFSNSEIKAILSETQFEILEYMEIQAGTNSLYIARNIK